MAEQKALARKNWAGSGDAGTEKVWFELQDKLGSSEFLGYTTLKSDAVVTALVQNGKTVEEVNQGEFYLLTNQTPFYAEMGGQVGDIGLGIGSNFAIIVTDTKKKCDGLYVHTCRIDNGKIKVGDTISLAVDEKNRANIQGNHTVTHLLHKALQEKFGSSVTQKGSYVAADRMRFDIAYNKQITLNEQRELENRVIEMIRSNYPVTTKIMNKDEAVKSGAMALFGEKYADEVRVVCVGDNVSTELCGGTHVKQTGDIGGFCILSDSAIAAGVRRLECVSGIGAACHTRELDDKVKALSALLKVGVNDLESRVAALLNERKEMENKIFELKKQLASGGSSTQEVEEINGIKLIAKKLSDIAPKEMKAIADEFKQKYPSSSIVVLLAENAGKSSCVVAVTDDIKEKFSAVDMVKATAPLLGAQGGGGRSDMAQTGGNICNRFDEAIDAVRNCLK